MITSLLAYLLVIVSITLLFFKLRAYGFNLLRINFLIFILVSLVPFCVLYEEHFKGEITSYYIFRIVFTIAFIALILIDDTRIKIDKESFIDRQIIYFTGILSSIISLSYIYIIGVGNFPLFNVFSGSYQELILMREDAFKVANIPIIFSYTIFYNKYFLIPFFCATLPVFWKEIHKKTAVCILAIMLLNQLLTLSKTAFFLMVLAPLVSYLFLTGVSLRKTIVASIMVLLVPLSILYVVQSDRDLVVTVLAILRRMFIIPELSALDYYTLFLDGEFRSITSSTVFSIFNQEQVINVQNYVYLKMNPDSILREGTAPGNIFGIAFVDMKEFIIVLYYAGILSFIYWLNRFLLAHRSKVSIGLQVSASIGVAFIYFTNFTTALNSYGVLLTILVSFFARKYPGGVRI